MLNIDNVGPAPRGQRTHQVLGRARGSRARSTSTSSPSRCPTTSSPRDHRHRRHLEGRRAPQDRHRPRRRREPRDRHAAEDGRRRPSRPPHRHTELPSLRVNKLAKADEDQHRRQARRRGMEGAASTGPFVDVGTGNPNTSFPVNGSAKLPWDDANLYVGLRGRTTPTSSAASQEGREGSRSSGTKDTVEIMVDPDGDGDNNGLLRDPDQPAEQGLRHAVRHYNTPEDRTRTAPSVTRTGSRS